MGTEVLKSFGTLQSELEQAKISLKDVDENIKRLIGRDPSDNQNRTGIKRPGINTDEARNRGRGQHNANFNNNRNKQNYENDEPPAKKRNSDSNVFKRLSERPARHFEEDNSDMLGKQLISKVIVTPKEIPSRQDVLAAQSADEKSKARNRRMFGALLGTLQKFRQEETKLKPKEEKRAQVEKKLEEQQIKEREELRRERQDLFFNRKRKQAEIRMIELKMTRMKEHTEWEEKQRPLMNYIQTKTKPHIYYLPKVLNDKNKELLESCRQNMEKMIDRKRQEVFEELNTIEQRMKKNFAQRQQSSNNDEKHDEDIMEHEIIDDHEIIDVHEPQDLEEIPHNIKQEKVEHEQTSATEVLIDNGDQESQDTTTTQEKEIENEKPVEQQPDDDVEEDANTIHTPKDEKRLSED